MKAKHSAFLVSQVRAGDQCEGCRIILFLVSWGGFMYYGYFSEAVADEAQNMCLRKICLGFVCLYLTITFLVF